MSIKYEYYDTGDTSWTNFSAIERTAQSFTPLITHRITSIKAKLFRGGSPGTINVGIRNTAAFGNPTGSDLCSGTLDGNSLTTDEGGAWYEVTLGDGYILRAGTKYAMVLACLGGSPGNEPAWRWDYEGASGYTRGDGHWSSDGGETFYPAYHDYMFEEWGVTISPLPVHFIV